MQACPLLYPLSKQYNLTVSLMSSHTAPRRQHFWYSFPYLFSVFCIQLSKSISDMLFPPLSPISMEANKQFILTELNLLLLLQSSPHHSLQGHIAPSSFLLLHLKSFVLTYFSFSLIPILLLLCLICSTIDFQN